MSSSTYRMPSTYSAMMCIDADTEITGTPVWVDDPLRGAVAGAGLVAVDAVVGHQVHGGPVDAVGLPVEDDRAVHLRQLAHTGGGELDVEGEAAGAQRLDGAVVAEHDQAPGASAEDPFEPVAQLRPRCHRRECLAELGVEQSIRWGHAARSVRRATRLPARLVGVSVRAPDRDAPFSGT